MPAFIQYLILSCLTCLAIIKIPSLIFVLAIIWGILLILAGLETDKRQLTIIFAINMLLLWVMSGNTYILYMGLPALAMGVMAVRKNSGYYDLLKAGLVTAAVAGVLLLSLVYISGDTGIKQIEPQVNTYVKESLKFYDDSGAFELYAQKGINQAEIEASIYQAVHVMVQHLPALYFLQIILIIAITLYLASRLARRRGIYRLEKRPFTREVMPWQTAWLVIAALGLWLWGSEASNTRLIGSNMLVILVPILAYFGISVLGYKLNSFTPSKKRWITILIVIISIILIEPIFIFLALLGLFDSLIDYRKLRIDKEAPL